jgi:glycosyltransferase involved in cell wall biosynthesis
VSPHDTINGGTVTGGNPPAERLSRRRVFSRTSAGERSPVEAATAILQALHADTAALMVQHAAHVRACELAEARQALNSGRLRRTASGIRFAVKAVFAGGGLRDAVLAASVLVRPSARRIWRQFFSAPEYYRANPDVAASGVPPALHYALLGYREGREPSANFSGLAYLRMHPDVAKGGLNPLVHYALRGVREGRSIGSKERLPVAGRSSEGPGVSPESAIIRVNTRWREDAPLVSVVIPCFNYGRYLEECLHSVLRQTWTDFEIIVVEGGSTDKKTRAEVRRLEEARLPRTRFLYRENRQMVGDNRNYGIQHARGRYVCCLDADDRLDPVYIEVAAYLAECAGFDLVYPSVRCFGDSDLVWLTGDAKFPDILKANSVSTVALFRRSAWAEVGGFRDWGLGAEHVPEDWDFWVRLLGHGYRGRAIRKPLLEYRVHAGSLSGDAPTKEEMDLWAQQIFDADCHLLQGWNRRRPVTAPVEVINPDCNVGDSGRNPEGPSGILLALPFVTVGGAERLLASLADSLAARGNRVVVTTSLALPNTVPEALEVFTRITPNVYDLPYLFPNDGERARFVLYLLDRYSIDALILAGSRLVYELLPQIRQRRPHIAIVDQLFNDVAHVASNREFRDTIDLTIVPSDAARASLIDTHGADPGSVVVIPHGLPWSSSQLDRPTKPVALPPSIPIVAFFGRLSEEKAPDVFVEIARELAPAVSAVFLMTGEGPLAGSIQDLIRRYRLEDRIITPGFVSTLDPLLERSDIVVIPSRLDGMPLIALEAMNARKPVVASAVGSLPVLVSHGETGYICEPGDVGAFCRHIGTLLADEALRHRMGAAGRETVLREHSSAAMIQRYGNALETAEQIARGRSVKPIPGPQVADLGG